jgi:hypothetical protein
VGALDSKLFAAMGATVLEDAVIAAEEGAGDERRTSIAGLQGRFVDSMRWLLRSPRSPRT